MKACFTSRTSYDRGRFDHISGATGLVDFISGSTGYIREVYITGEDGEWCQLTCSGQGAFSCDDLLGCNVLYSTGHQTLSGDLTVTGYLSGSSLYIENCNLAVTTGGRIGIGTCDPQCDVDIHGDVCHTSGNFVNYSGYISGQTGYLQEMYITGSDGEWCKVSCSGAPGPSSDCALTDWVEAFEEDENGDLQPTDSCCVSDTAWLLRANGDLVLRANYFSCCGSNDIMVG